MVLIITLNTDKSGLNIIGADIKNTIDTKTVSVKSATEEQVFDQIEKHFGRNDPTDTDITVKLYCRNEMVITRFHRDGIGMENHERGLSPIHRLKAYLSNHGYFNY